MILDDIIDMMLEVIRSGHVVDDEKIDRRLVQDFIMLKRNQFAKNYINEKSSYEDGLLQTEVLTLSPYDSELSLGGLSIGNKILKTNVCPRFIEGNLGIAVKEITTASIMGKTIQLVPMDRLRWCGNGKTNRYTIFAGYSDDCFFVRARTQMDMALDKLYVNGIYADPTLVSTYVRATSHYPVNDYMIEYMKNAILQTDFNVMKQTKSDNINNANGETEISTKG